MKHYKASRMYMLGTNDNKARWGKKNKKPRKQNQKHDKGENCTVKNSPHSLSSSWLSLGSFASSCRWAIFVRFFLKPCLPQTMVCSSSQQKTCIFTKNAISVLQDMHKSVLTGQLCWPSNRMLGINASTCIDIYLKSKKVDKAIEQSNLWLTSLKPLQKNSCKYQHKYQHILHRRPDLTNH